MSGFVSTRDPRHCASFRAAVEANLAPDGGLYLPAELRPLPHVGELLAMDFMPRSIAVLEHLTRGELGVSLPAVVERAFNFPVPLAPITERISSLELFHGPTLAFKDFGARFLAEVLELFGNAEAAPRLILTATSGDTGGAVAHAFHGREGVKVAVLYPRGLVSPLQEKQFAALGGNVTAFAVDGSFDDCQALVKACFADPELSRELRLTSANSINLARLLAQVPYAFEAVAQWQRVTGGEAPVIAVPSGNFGNLAAALIARRLGLPVRAFVAATNANATVPEFLAGSPYRPRPSVATLSNAMDVGAPNNWERVVALFEGDETCLRRELRGAVATEADTRRALRKLAALDNLADPHTAVAFHGLEQTLRPGERGILFATAHPAKFREVVEPEVGRTIPLPPALKALESLPSLALFLDNNVERLKALLRHVSSGRCPR